MNPEKQKDGSLKQMRDVWQLPLVQGKKELEERTIELFIRLKNQKKCFAESFSHLPIKEMLFLIHFWERNDNFCRKKLSRNWIGIEKIKIF